MRHLISMIVLGWFLVAASLLVIWCASMEIANRRASKPLRDIDRAWREFTDARDVTGGQR